MSYNKKRLSNKSYEALPLGTQASRLRGPRKQREVGCSLRGPRKQREVGCSLRGPRKQREVGCSLRAFWNKTKVLAVIVAPYKPFTYKRNCLT